MNTHHERANVLIEALPYIQRLSGKTIVVKYGGAAMLDDNLKKRFMEDITLLKFVGMNPIVVHGGGPDINGTLSALHIETKFHNGLRVTDEETMKVVQMVLTGRINKDIVAGINACGGKAVGLCGIDGHVISAHKRPPVEGVDLGCVGEIDSVDTKLLNMLTSDEYIDRFMGPAGLTGLWQVEKRGSSGKMSADERKQLDIKYAKTFSFQLDMKIILRTFTAFIQKENV